MDKVPSVLTNWSPTQIEDGRRWVETWRRAGIELERIRRAELRNLDVRRAIALLCATTTVPQKPRATSGLVEQQRWFKLFVERIRSESANTTA